MTDATTLERFLRRARRRAVAAVLVEQAVAALGAAFAGLILLLFLGSRILDWRWVLALCAATFLFGVFRTLRRVPSPHELAQQSVGASRPLHMLLKNKAICDFR